MRKVWQSERLGLAMIGASLLVIAAILSVMLVQERNAAEASVRAQATGLARLLTALPAADLSSSTGADLLRALAASQPPNALAYAVVSDGQGRTLHSVGATPAPPAAPAQVRLGEIAERRIALDATPQAEPREIIEFQSALAPLTSGAVQIRLGFFLERNPIKLDRIPFFATLALAVFLLTPIFYFLVRSETRPILKVAEELGEITGNGRFRNLRWKGRGVSVDFVRRFNEFAGFAESKLTTLESENAQLLTTAKLIGYQKQRLERVLEALPEAVVLLDEAGAVTFANSKLRGVFGVVPEDAVGRPIEDWCKERKIVDFVKRCMGKGVARKLSQSLEFAPPAAPNDIVSLRIWPLLGAQGDTGSSGALLVFRDATAEHLAARSRGEFVGHLAHELKTPLNVLGMYSEMLQGEDGRDETQRIEAVNAISDEVQRLAALIDNLLNITRIEMGSLQLERTRVNLRDLMQDCFKHVARAGREKGLTFAIEAPESIPSAALDKGLFRVALNNLLTNAIKYSNAGGSVTMGAEETADRIRIHVTDTGIGIRPEYREKIFEKFFRADDGETRSRSGHGLGLSLARDIVQLHHGTITVESEVGKGSKFCIELWKDAVMLQRTA